MDCVLNTCIFHLVCYSAQTTHVSFQAPVLMTLFCMSPVLNHLSTTGGLYILTFRPYSCERYTKVEWDFHRNSNIYSTNVVLTGSHGVAGVAKLHSSQMLSILAFPLA